MSEDPNTPEPEDDETFLPPDPVSEEERFPIEEAFRILKNRFNIEPDEARTIIGDSREKLWEFIIESSKMEKFDKMNMDEFLSELGEKSDKAIQKKVSSYRLSPDNKRQLQQIKKAEEAREKRKKALIKKKSGQELPEGAPVDEFNVSEKEFEGVDDLLKFLEEGDEEDEK